LEGDGRKILKKMEKNETQNLEGHGRMKKFEKNGKK